MIRKSLFIGSLIALFIGTASADNPPIPVDQLNILVPNATPSSEITLSATGGTGPYTFEIPGQPHLVGQAFMIDQDRMQYVPRSGFSGVEYVRFTVTDSLGMQAEGLLGFVVDLIPVETRLYLDFDPQMEQGQEPGAEDYLLASATDYASLILNFDPRAIWAQYNLPSGYYNFYVYAVTERGHASSNSRHLVDVDPPVITWANRPAENAFVAGNISFSMRTDEGEFDDCPSITHVQDPQLRDPRTGLLVSFIHVTNPPDGSCLYSFPTYDTRSLLDGERDFRALAADTPGNTSDDIQFRVRVDNSGPVISLIDFDPVLPVNRIIRGSVNVRMIANDLLSGIGTLTLLSRAGNNDISLGTNNNQTMLVATWNTQNFSDGSYNILGNALDVMGNPSTLLIEPAIIVDNTAPTASITSPVNNATVNGQITIEADASDNHGINRVEFYIDNAVNPLGTDTTFPYSQTWDTLTHANAPAVIRIKAFDSIGNEKNVSINVTVNNQDLVPPTVALLSPVDGSHVRGLVNVSGTANDNVAVTRVELMVDNVVDQTIYNPASSYNFSWDTTRFSNGNRQVQVRAFDSQLSTLSNLVTVVVDNIAPDTAVITPTTGQHVKGTISFIANATDNIGVTQVEFFIDANSRGLGTGNGQIYSIPPINTVGLSDGAHNFYTVARDAAHNERTSTVVSVTVDNTRPATAVTFPTEGSSVNGFINIQGTATDNIGVSQVEFFLDGNSIGLGTANGNVYSISSFNTQNLVNGSHRIYTVARDAADNTRTSIEVNFNINNNDSTLPVSAITAPLNNTYLRGLVVVSAEATDFNGINRVEFLVDGDVRHTDTTSPYTFDWLTTAVSNSGHVLTAVAYDPSDNPGTSFPINVVVDNQAPVATLNHPIDGESVRGQISIEANATDNENVIRAELWVDGSLSETHSTLPPYQFDLNTIPMTNNFHTVEVKVFDAAGNFGLDNAQISVDNLAPVISIMNPVAGQVVNGIQAIETLASDNVAVSYVEFYVDSDLLSTDNAGPTFSASWNTVVYNNGDHSLTAKAFDAAGNNTLSVPVVVTVSQPDNNPPTAHIIHPLDNTDIRGTVQVTGVATDNEGIDEVVFKVDSDVKAIIPGNQPYTFVWNTTGEEGAHTLEMKAIDTSDNTDTHIINVFVDNTPPTVEITSPLEGDIINSDITIRGNAADNRSISKVEFYVDSHYRGEILNPSLPFEWTWLNSSNANHTLEVKAFDAAGNNTMSAPVHVTVNQGDSTPPVAEIQLPLDNSDVRGLVTISGVAADNQGMDHVIFKADGQEIANLSGAGPYVTEWNSIGHDGAVIIEMTAFDTSLLSGTDSITVYVDNQIPQVAIHNPASNAKVRSLVIIQANASDNRSIRQVNFYIDGDLKHSDMAGPSYTYPWNTSNESNSSHVIRAEAVDAAGNINSSLVNVTVDNAAPSVVISHPLSGSQVSGLIIVTAAASDNDVVDHVDFYVDGAFAQTDSQGPEFSYSWDTANLSDAHQLQATAYDEAGNFASSPVVDVTIAQDQGDTVNPSVSITAPAANSLLRSLVNVTAVATDNVAIDRVEFRVDGSLKETISGSGPYVYVWNTTETSNAQHQIEAKAFDTSNNFDVNTIQVMVDNDAPMISVLSPQNGSTVHGNISIVAPATDNFDLNRAEIYLDSDSAPFVTLGGNGTVFEFTHIWNTGALPEGQHSIFVRVFDQAGNSTNSAVINVLVDNNDTTPPAVTLIVPSNNDFVRSLVVMSALATDDFGINRVEFLKDGEVLHTDYSAPYEYQWDTTNITLSAVQLTAKAFDGADNSTESVSVPVTVDNVIPVISNFIPAEGVTISGIQPVSFAALETGALARAELWVGPNMLRSVDYSTEQQGGVQYSFDTESMANGNYAIRAHVVDQAGNVNDQTHNVNIQNGAGGPAPVITILDPRNVDEFVRAIKYIRVRIINNPTTREIRIDSGLPLRDATGDFNNLPSDNFIFEWDTTQYTEGPHTINVTASNADGSAQASLPVRVDNTAPAVSWIFPTEPNTTLFWIPNLRANASDTLSRLDSVQIRIGEVIIGSRINNPENGEFSFPFDTEQTDDNGDRVYPDNSEHTLYATAIDQAGNSTTLSMPIRINNTDIPPSEGHLVIHPARDSFVVTDEAAHIWVHPENATIDPASLNARTFQVTYEREGVVHHINGNGYFDPNNHIDLHFGEVIPPNSRITNVTVQVLDDSGLLLREYWNFTRGINAAVGGIVTSADRQVVLDIPARSLPYDAFVDIGINYNSPDVQQANEASRNDFNGQTLAGPYYIVCQRADGSSSFELGEGFPTSFTFQQEVNRIPEPERNYVFQPQVLMTGSETSYWRPLTGLDDLLRTTDNPTIKTITVPITRMGVFRVTSFPAPAAGVTEFFNYPNPFSPDQGGTNINYLLGEDSEVKIIIYDLLGNLVKRFEFASGSTGGQVGQNIVHWDGKNGEGVVVANGGYILQILAKTVSGQEYKARTKAGVAK